MKKKILTIISLLVFFGFIKTANAATLSVSGNASTLNTVVGNTFTVTFNYSSSTPLGAVVYSMTYDSSKLTLISGIQSNAVSYTGTQKSDSVKYTFKAKSNGSADITFKINEALDFDENVLQAGSVSKTINIKTQKEIEASYSKNNNLNSLTIDKAELSPAFDKNITNYSATVENDVTKIIVNGSKEDNKSSVTGLKEYELEEGINKIEIRVTAQNGSSKSYIIDVNRKELEPINVTLANEEFTVVRKKELLISPNDSFTETTIEIEEKEIPVFYNEATKTYLVGLKNNDGEIKLYQYENNTYKEYKEISFNSLVVTIKDLKEVPEGFKEEKIKINDEDVTVYVNENNDYLVNGINIKTGKENLYRYDNIENTLQVYNTDLLTKIDELNNDKNTYLFVIIGLGALLIITYIVLLVSSLKTNKSKKKKKEKSSFSEKLDNFFFEEEKDESTKEKKKEEEKEKVEEEKKEEKAPEDIDLYTREIIELDTDLQKTKKINDNTEKKEKKNENNDKIKEDVSKDKKNKKK